MLVGVGVLVYGLVVVGTVDAVVVVVGRLGAHMASMRRANLEAQIGAEDAPEARHMAATR